MAERRITHVRQTTTGSPIISQEYSGQHSPNSLSTTNPGLLNPQLKDPETGEPLKPRFKTTWHRFIGRGRKPVGVIQSIKKIYGCSCTSPPPV